jgi:predicted metal-dependent hydrolase
MPATAASATDTTRRDRIVGRDGRAKAYRPLPLEARRAAIEAGLAAYDRGDFFEAHEELEPAWMGSDDPAERALLQGLIKVAAAYVHDVRGNPAGVRTNLTGARRLLAEAAEAPAENAAGLDVDALLADVDARLADLDAHPDAPTLSAPVLRYVAPR